VHAWRAIEDGGIPAVNELSFEDAPVGVGVGAVPMSPILEELRFRGGLVFEAHRLLYHSA